MKYSKIGVVGIVITLFFSSFTPLSKPPEDSFIEVYFSNKLNLADLAKIQSDLAEKEIRLNYDYLKFGNDGQLAGIEYHVKAWKVGGSDSTSDTRAEIGFIIDTAKNPKYGIIVGPKNAIQKRRMVLEKGN